MQKNRGSEKLDKITAIALKRGFFWPSAEIYGGKAGLYNYGHLGKSLKSNFENLWRKYFLQENSYEIESSIILPEAVFKASGHLESFNDPLVECKSCHFRFRADQLIEDTLNKNASAMTIKQMNEVIKKNNLKCTKCKSNKLSEAKWFNMMFPIEMGATGTKDVAYLTPETAQASYLAFKREFEATRKKLPLGIAIIGKAFRNEISPRQLFFRLREFEQAELQIFFDPDEIEKLDSKKWRKISKYKLQLKKHNSKDKSDFKLITCENANKKLKIPKFYVYYMAMIQKFYFDFIKIPKKLFRFRELDEKERAFYNKIHWDIEIHIQSLNGFKEVSGIHYRTDHDLKGHEKQSKQNLKVFYNNKTFIPHVLELSFGVDRNIWALLDIFYKEEKERNIFNFPEILAPVQIAIFPLVSKEKMPEIALEIWHHLKNKFSCFYDETSSIGRRYRRQDEIGTPFCITVDAQTTKNKTVTVRERDTMKQKRIKISKLTEFFEKEFN